MKIEKKGLEPSQKPLWGRTWNGPTRRGPQTRGVRARSLRSDLCAE